MDRNLTDRWEIEFFTLHMKQKYKNTEKIFHIQRNTIVMYCYNSSRNLKSEKNIKWNKIIRRNHKPL